MITKGKLKLVFDSEKYLKDLEYFIIGQMEDPAFREQLNNFYKEAYREAWEGHGPGKPEWYTDQGGPFHAMDHWGKYARVQPRIDKNGKISMIIGIPPPGDEYYGAEADGFKYWQFVLEYGIGSEGIGHGSAQKGKPLTYHHVGEKTWTPDFEYQRKVTNAPFAGTLMRQPMNQPGTHQFPTIRERVYECFRQYAYTWLSAFQDIYPFSDYIKFK